MSLALAPISIYSVGFVGPVCSETEDAIRDEVLSFFSRKQGLFNMRFLMNTRVTCGAPALRDEALACHVNTELVESVVDSLLAAHLQIPVCEILCDLAQQSLALPCARFERNMQLTKAGIHLCQQIRQPRDFQGLVYMRMKRGEKAPRISKVALILFLSTMKKVALFLR